MGLHPLVNMRCAADGYFYFAITYSSHKGWTCIHIYSSVGAASRNLVIPPLPADHMILQSVEEI
jgi:hypothetical protein